ncbi:MAG TPA: LEA type 2 family protein [Thermoanaerobaculia bacterium]|jgi:LEA14-like dessication related protein|nr:LEA type 2 family protein [Thermoanaerobaculia bacterium]
MPTHSSTTGPSRRLVGTVLVLLLPLAVGGCAALHLERPRVSLVDVGLENVGLLQSSLVIGLRVENPNSFRLPIERGVYTFFLGGERVGVGGTRTPLDVPAHGMSNEQIVIQLDNLRLLSRLRGLLDRQAVGYRIEADHYISGFRSQALHSVAEGELDGSRIDLGR